MGLLSCDFGSSYPRKPIKASKDAEYNIVSERNLYKKRLVGLAPRANYTKAKGENLTPL